MQRPESQICWEAVTTTNAGGKWLQVVTTQCVTGRVVVQGRLMWSIETEDGEVQTIPRSCIVRVKEVKEHGQD